MKNALNILLAAGGLFGAPFASRAQLFYNSGSLPGGAVPDDGSPIPFSHVVSSSGITSITGVKVQLNLAGNPAGTGWAGDMFASLNYNLGSQTAILLNQAGVNGGNPAGFGFDGWSVTLQDGAANGDIHLGQPTLPDTILTGIWEPDGRLSPTDASRPGLLSVFDGLPGDGTWYLTLSDMSSGGSMTLNDWSLEVTGVPEASETAVVMLTASGLLVLLRRARRAKQEQ